MGEKTYFQPRAGRSEMVIITATVTVGNSGAVSSQTNGDLVTIAKSGTTGEYTCTLHKSFDSLEYVDASSIAATAELSVWDVDSETVATNGVFTVRHSAEGAGTLAAAWPTSGNKFKVLAIVRNSSVAP